MKTIDWKIFDKFPESECECTCGSIYHSHAKMVMVDDKLILYSRVPCPGCRETSNHLRAVRGKPEKFSI